MAPDYTESVPRLFMRNERGEELGRFNMGGSTIIILFGSECVRWQSGLVPDMRVQFSQSLGHVERPPTK